MPVDSEKQVAYWRKGADEDWQAGMSLLRDGQIRHSLFFIHLAVEKLLKARYCRRQRDMAPRGHNLTRLAELGELTLTGEQQDILADLNAFNLEGRYPDERAAPVPKMEAERIVEKAGEVFQWLKNQL